MSSDTANHLLDLADAFARHMNLSHWRVSFLARGDGQFFKRLGEGKSCTLRTAEHVLKWFDANWPSDLAWPKHIARPSEAGRASGRAA